MLKENSVDLSVDESQEGWDHSTGKFQRFAADLNLAKEHDMLKVLRLCCFAVNSPLFQLQVEMVKKSLVAWEEETGARSQEHKIA